MTEMTLQVYAKSEHVFRGKVHIYINTHIIKSLKDFKKRFHHDPSQRQSTSQK